MFKTVIALALVALVAAKPQITTENNDLKMVVDENQDIKFERKVTKSISVFELSSQISSAEEAVAKIPSVSQLQEWNAQLDAIEASVTTQLDSLKTSSLDSLKTRFQGLLDTALVDANKASSTIFQKVQAKLVEGESKINAMNTEVRGSVDSKIKAGRSANDKKLNALKSKLTNSISSLEKKVQSTKSATDNAVKQLTNTVTNSLAAAEKTAADKIKKAKDDIGNWLKTQGSKITEAKYPKQIVWSGGCRSHGHSDGWRPYCHNGEDFNTAGNHLQKIGDNSGSTFRVKVAGWYRINWWGIGTRHYNYVGIWHNGRHIHHGHDYCDGNWHDEHADIMWKFNVGDKFWVQIHGGGHGYWNYHSWNSGGAHSRMQIEYLGVA